MASIAVIGGTGHLGKAIARRLAKAGHEVTIGSRTADKAQLIAAEIGAAHGDDNAAAAQGKEIVIVTVPYIYPGAGRKVYPGFLQLTGFMAMNLGNHLASHWGMFRQLVDGDGESADATKAFYEEYRAVCDMTEEFYLQTIDVVFQRHLLPKGKMTHRGRRVDPAAIRDIALLAIEGERDDISGIGQTKAALDISTRLPRAMKHYHLAKGVGHYGIFNGSKWRDRIAPVVEDWIAKHD
jgi:poly(3-hydroxybutyrate) depolymerase